jgi:hypothetical protein
MATTIALSRIWLRNRQTAYARRYTSQKDKMKRKKKRDIFSFLFVPHYDELSLFTMSFVCVLLILVNNPPHKWNMLYFTSSPGGIGSLLIFLPFLVGMFLCVYHAFSDRMKSRLEKKLMIFFAAIINGFSGIWGGTYILIHSSGWALSIFPIWNIVSGYILLGLLRDDDIEEECIGDKNVSLIQVLAGSIIIFGIFSLCHFVFNLIWSATFSICIVWATNINSRFNSLIFSERVKSTQG